MCVGLLDLFLFIFLAAIAAAVICGLLFIAISQLVHLPHHVLLELATVPRRVKQAKDYEEDVSDTSDIADSLKPAFVGSSDGLKSRT